MKKIWIMIILSFLLAPKIFASEFLGTISTQSGLTVSESEEEDSEEIPNNNDTTTPGTPNTQNSSLVLIPQKTQNEEPKNEFPEEKSKKNNQKRVGKVLGVKIFRDGELIRSWDKRIYVIEGNFRKQIRTLKELQKYRGRTIDEVSAEQIEQFPIQNYPNGSLIKTKGEAKIYVIENGRKRHIRSLKELREKYLKKDIFSISKEEISLY